MQPTECNTAANGVNVHGVVIKDLRFADNVDLLAEEELQSLVDQLHTNSKEYGLQINTNKSKSLSDGHIITQPLHLTQAYLSMYQNLSTLEAWRQRTMTAVSVVSVGSASQARDWEC